MATTKLESPQRTFDRGVDLSPNGLLKTFPAAPKAKCGAPLPRKKPIMKYQKRNRSNPNYAAPGRVGRSFRIALIIFIASSTCLAGFICELKTCLTTPFVSITYVTRPGMSPMDDGTP